jgi:hypothetical protein
LRERGLGVASVYKLEAPQQVVGQDTEVLPGAVGPFALELPVRRNPGQPPEAPDQRIARQILQVLGAAAAHIQEREDQQAQPATAVGKGADERLRVIATVEDPLAVRQIRPSLTLPAPARQDWGRMRPSGERALSTSPLWDRTENDHVMSPSLQRPRRASAFETVSSPVIS